MPSSRYPRCVAHAVVLGGGFGGIATAVALREQLDRSDEVTLIERRNDFVMGVRKTWHLLAISPLEEGTRSLAGLEERGVHVRQGEVTAIDPVARTVTLDGQSISADALVIALGASLDLAAIPGLAEHAFVP